VRMRSRVTLASLALPFQTRQCRRSTSATITALACSRSGVSTGRLGSSFGQLFHAVDPVTDLARAACPPIARHSPFEAGV